MLIGSACPQVSCSEGDMDVGTVSGSTTSASAGNQTGSGGTSDGGSAGVGGGNVGGSPVASSCTDMACAFPGAEGFGTATPGGRGGRVMVVSTLDPEGPGSFTEAVLATGPRIVVFSVSGVIDFNGASLDLNEDHSYLTVAGQSSPGGITLKNVTLSSYHAGFHDAVFRFLRLRGPDTYDNLSFATVHNIVIDHVDFSGGSDEAFDITYGHDFTVQWSTITNSTSGDGSQNYGALIAYKPTTRISWHHNLSVSHKGRCGAQMHWAGDNPEPVNGAEIDYRNNVFHNCGFQQILRADNDSPTLVTKFNLVGNFAKSGPDTPAESMVFGLGGEVHMSDNVYEGQSLVLTPYFDDVLRDTPHAFPPVSTTSSMEAYDQVLAWAGAWPRDAMNQRTVLEVRNGTGQLGKQDDALLEPNTPAFPDADADGMPDAWETANGLNPMSPADATTIVASGYSNIEVYLAERAAELIGQ
jgi:pectate lyase